MNSVDISIYISCALNIRSCQPLITKEIRFRKTLNGER